MYINNLGHMTKMAAMPIYGKNLSKIYWTNFKETWHEALMAKVLQSMYIQDRPAIPRLELTRCWI